MSQRPWLLVEWLDEREIFPSYGIIHVGFLIGNDSKTPLHVGKMIFVRSRHGSNPRRAQVLKIADDKRYVKERKKSLEREDHRLGNVLALCMRTIREVKSGSMYSGFMNPPQQVQPSSSGASVLPQILADFQNSSSEDTSSTSETQIEIGGRRSKQVAHNSRFNRDGSSTSRDRQLSRRPGSPQSCRSMVCSTPVSTTPRPMTFDQGTQTDVSLVAENKEKFQHMDNIIKTLYQKFMLLTAQVEQMTGEREGTRARSVEWSGLERNNAEVSGSGLNGSPSPPEHVGGSGGPVNGPVKSNAKPLQVRRMSAHTTNNAGESGHEDENEMVPVGDCNTMVPRRVLNDIDWSNYSTATRQLLQAVFPRKVLATHSLTGKQSPAFMNRPPKKRLDPRVVDDIVISVAERCGVPHRIVRTVITTKCTDEARLFRNRQQVKHARQAHQNQENVPPFVPSSDDSSTTPTE